MQLPHGSHASGFFPAVRPLRRTAFFMMYTFTTLFKLARVGLHLLRGLVIVRWGFDHFNDRQRQEHKKLWAQQLLGLLAIDLRVIGELPAVGPVLLVANHVSWLDIVALLACCRCRFVAKADIAHWPVVGTFTRATDTLFITRESRRDALRVVHQLTQALRPEEGATMVVFPEGTTSNGTQVLAFHANLFQAAISSDAPVQTLALRYEDAATGQHSVAPAYIDDDTLLGSIWRTLAAPRQRVVLRFGPPRRCDGRTRQQWAADAQADVATLLASSG